MIRWMFSILGDERKRYYKLESLAELISTYLHSKPLLRILSRFSQEKLDELCFYSMNGTVIIMYKNNWGISKDRNKYNKK